MNLLTNEEQKTYENAKTCCIDQKNWDKHAKDKNYWEVRDHCQYSGEHRGPARSVCNSKFSVPKEIPMVFHNGSNYDYHFITKEVAKEFERKFTC